MRSSLLLCVDWLQLLLKRLKCQYLLGLSFSVQLLKTDLFSDRERLLRGDSPDVALYKCTFAISVTFWLLELISEIEK